MRKFFNYNALVYFLPQMKHLMGWAEPEYDSSDTDSDIIEKELCHPLCQCRKCAPTQRVCPLQVYLIMCVVLWQDLEAYL